MVAFRQPGGVIVFQPFRVNHMATELQTLVEQIRTMPGELWIVMDRTGSYSRSIAFTLVKGRFSSTLPTPCSERSMSSSRTLSSAISNTSATSLTGHNHPPLHPQKARENYPMQRPSERTGLRRRRSRDSS